MVGGFGRYHPFVIRSRLSQQQSTKTYFQDNSGQFEESKLQEPNDNSPPAGTPTSKYFIPNDQLELWASQSLTSSVNHPKLITLITDNMKVGQK